MRRRAFIAAVGGAALALPSALRAQQPAAQPLVGVLSPLSEAAARNNIEAFQRGLGENGYVEGRNVEIALRFAEGRPERLDELAAGLVALKPAVIVAGSTPGTLAVHRASNTVPLIMIAIFSDPVALGLAASLAMPGGHVTGFSAPAEDALVGKRIEFLKELIPGLARVGIMVNPDDPADAAVIRSAPATSRTLGMEIHQFDVHAPAEIEQAFAAARKDGAQALFVSQTPVFNVRRKEIARLAIEARLPTVFGFREFVDDGGLMSYGASLSEMYRDSAKMMDKIVKGARVGDLPFERPTKFELLINMRTAKALGLAIPPALLARADAVIE